MRYTEIYYRTINDNIEHVENIYEQKGWEENYTQSVLNRIESIVDARDKDGKQCAVVIGIKQHNQEVGHESERVKSIIGASK